VYDGKYFRTLRYSTTDIHSLPGDWIRSITEDANGLIWIGTDKGICSIHPLHLKCTRYLPGVKMQADVKPEYSRLINAGDGKIWALSTNYLMCLVNDSFICVNPVKYHGNLATGNSHEIMVVSRGEVMVKNLESGKVENKKLNNQQVVDYTCVYQDVLGNYWLGTWGDGVFCYNPAWQNPQNFKWDPNPFNPSTTNIINCITGDSSRVYIATSNGVYIYNLHQPLVLDQPAQHWQHVGEDPHGITAGMVNHIAIDKRNNIWVGTSGGLNVSLALNRAFDIKVNNTGLITDFVWWKDTLITSSWYGQGLSFFDKNLNLLHSIHHVPENKTELNNSQISGLDLDNKGNLWIATFNGLVNYSLQRQQTRAYYTKENAGLATNRLNDVWWNEMEQEVWTANYDAGITRLNLSTGQVVQLNSKNNSFFTNDLVWGFYKDNQGRVWVLTNAGLMMYNPATHAWSSWRTIQHNGKKMELGNAHVILQDSRGYVWLGTENGLFIYIHQQWYYKGLEHGLPERMVNGLAEDRQGNIWVAFNHALVCWNAHTGSSFVLSTSHGILLPSIHSIIGNRILDKMYVCTENSLVEIHKNQLLQNPASAPKVYLDKFVVNGKNYFTQTRGFDIEKKNFAYDENNVEIDFITPHIGEIGLLLYSYRVEKGAWSTPAENKQLILPRLAPGTHRIEIKATADGVHWSEQPLLIQFAIHPPFWATWWFRTMVITLLLIIIIWWVRFLSTRKMKLKILELEKQQAIEKERNRLSRDMHDDLGSGLTKISILSEVVKKKIDPNPQVENYLENISDSSRELVQNLNNIIWALNPGNDRLQALLAYTREYAARFLEGCQVNFEYQNSLHSFDQPVTEQVKRNLFLVIKESLNNAVKHGKPTLVKLWVELKNGNQLCIRLEDNGVGFTPTNATLGNGLKNMEKRMREIGGSFSIHAITQGTVTTIMYPL
jgi:signal transduction histidine kinase/ligand-binding sensor domain-containing protein